jgi:tetratricopeptide (TPR) repeat protein
VDRFDWLELESPGSASPAAELPADEPLDGPTFYRAARRMREAGHFRAASTFYEKVTSLDPHHYRAWVEWIDTLVRARQLEAAGLRSEQAQEMFRRVRSIYAARGLVLLHDGRLREALNHITVGLEGEEDTWYAKCIRAEFELRRDVGASQEALLWLDRGTDTAAPPWEGYFIGGWMLLDAQLPTLAASYFAEAGHRHPRAPLSWLCLGDCFAALRMYDQALFYYRRVLELEPTHEVAIERQKRVAPKLFGLMRGFRKEDLRERWNREFRKSLNHD